VSQTNLPSTKRFYSEDYKDAPPWFQRFLSQLNLYTEPIYNVLNQAVDFMQNTTGEYYTYVLNNASPTPKTNTFTFTPKKFVGKPNAVIPAQILYASNPAQTTFYLAAPSIDWTWTGSQVKVTAVYGLVPNMTYNITLLIW